MPKGKHNNHSRGAQHPRWKTDGVLQAANGYRLVRVGREHPLADVYGYAYQHREVPSEKKVRDIQPLDEDEVWDIQVEEDASFTAEGCIVHNCPLQLDVIERCIQLWTNPGEIVFSPFAGIGSELYVALQQGRRGIGIELKESYFLAAKKNLERVLREMTQGTLFGDNEVQSHGLICELCDGQGCPECDETLSSLVQDVIEQYRRDHNRGLGIAKGCAL